MPVVPLMVVPVMVLAVAMVPKPEAMEPPVKIPTEVKEEVITVEFKVLPVRVAAGAMTTAVLAAVNLPWASTVKVGMAVEEP